MAATVVSKRLATSYRQFIGDVTAYVDNIQVSGVSVQVSGLGTSVPLYEHRLFCRRKPGPLGQVRDHRLCHLSKLIVVSGVRFQVSVKNESWVLNPDWVEAESHQR